MEREIAKIKEAQNKIDEAISGYNTAGMLPPAKFSEK